MRYRGFGERRQSRAAAQSAPRTGDGFREPALLDLRKRQIVEGVGIRRLVDEVLLKTGDGFSELALLGQQDPQRVRSDSMPRP